MQPHNSSNETETVSDIKKKKKKISPRTWEDFTKVTEKFKLPNFPVTDM